MTPETQDYEVQYDATRNPSATNYIRRGRAQPEKRYRIHVDVRGNGTSIPNSYPRAKGPGVSAHLILRTDWEIVQKLVYGRTRDNKYPEFGQIDPTKRFVSNEEEDRRIEDAKRIAANRQEDKLRALCERAQVNYESVDWKAIELTTDENNRPFRRMLNSCWTPWQAVFQENEQRSPLPLRWARIVADEDMEDDDERRRQRVLQESSQAQMEAFGDKLAQVIGGKSDEVAALKAELAEVKALLSQSNGGRKRKSKQDDES